MILFPTSHFLMRSHLLHTDSKSTQLLRTKTWNWNHEYHNLSNPRALTNPPPLFAQALHWKHPAPISGHVANPLLSPGRQLQSSHRRGWQNPKDLPGVDISPRWTRWIPLLPEKSHVGPGHICPKSRHWSSKRLDVLSWCNTLICEIWYDYPRSMIV